MGCVNVKSFELAVACVRRSVAAVRHLLLFQQVVLHEHYCMAK